MNLELMKNLCSLDKNKLYSVLVKFLHKKGYKKIYRDTKYIFAEGTIPVCLLAHIDTVFAYAPEIDEFFYDPKKAMLWAPYGSGFDDRAGLYSIIQLIEMGYRPHVIFTDEEERGGVGARELVTHYPICPFEECKMLIQLDRANEKDAVFYNCDNEEFTKFIESYGFEFDMGTFTDISVIAPVWKIAAVNLSVGYLDEHSYCERLMCNWCDATIDKVCNILIEAEDAPSFEYIQKKFDYGKYYASKLSTTGTEYTDFECAVCGKPITSYKDAKFYATKDFNYCICRECEEKYNIASPSEEDYDDDTLPF